MSNLDNKKSLSTGQKKDDKQNPTKVMKNREVTLINSRYELSIPYVHKPVYKMFQQKEYSLLKEHFENMDVYFKGQTFNSHFEFKEFLIRIEKINLLELLEISDNFFDDKPFPNVLNTLDTNSTATTFRSNTKGIEYYVYKQGNKTIKLNLIQLISKLINEEQQETIEIIADIFSIKINIPIEILDVRDNAKVFVDNIRKGNLNDSMPNFIQVFGKDLELVCFLIETISKQEYYMMPREDTNIVLSYISVDGYRQIYESKYTGYLKSRSKINKFIQAMTLADTIIKHNLIDLPISIQSILENYRIKNKMDKRTDVISIPNFTSENLKCIENQCEIMISKNFNMNTISKNMVISTYGMGSALKVFSQIKDNEKILAKRLVNTKINASDIIAIQLSKKGYVTEKHLIDRLFRNKRKSKIDLKKDEIVWEIEQLRQVICEENNLEAILLTKDLRLELNVLDKDIPKGKRPRIYKPKQ